MSGFDEAGTRDAAVLLLALGEETAAEVFKHLTPKEVQGLGEVMARTQYTTKEHIEQVLEHFHQQASKQSTLVYDPSAYVRGVLKCVLGNNKAGMVAHDGGDLLGRSVAGNGDRIQPDTTDGTVGEQGADVELAGARGGSQALIFGHGQHQPRKAHGFDVLHGLEEPREQG